SNVVGMVKSLVRMRALILVGALVCAFDAGAQQTTPPSQQPASPQQAQQPTTTPDEGGPLGNDSGIVLPKKKEEPAPPPAPAEERPANAGGPVYSLQVTVPVVSLDVNVLLDKTKDFVAGLKAPNFLVVEDGVPQKVQSLRAAKTPITAVMLLEFAANNWAFIQDMQNVSEAFFHSIQPDDYIAIETYDIKPHVLTDFTNNKDTLRDALNSLVIPTFRETNEFDALYETLDRLSRVDGRKYVVLISSGVDTMSRLDYDEMLAKIKATPNVTIFTISTGGFAREFDTGSGSRHMTLLQADNEMKTFADMTGGVHFKPIFQGELPDLFTKINDSIRNQYVLTYRPTNAKQDGKYRKVKVYLVDNEGKPLRVVDEKGVKQKYSVITRDGYKAKLPVE
ncbi:MAG: VWA domain-containing protein, partial [Bryocella sp.]